VISILSLVMHISAATPEPWFLENSLEKRRYAMKRGAILMVLVTFMAAAPVADRQHRQDCAGPSIG